MKRLPQFVSFGEALTDLIRCESMPGDPRERWLSVPGGAPWNVARMTAGFGVDSAFGGGIGRDCFGDALWQASATAGLDLRFLQRFDKSPLLAIVHETQPPRYFFVGDDSADLQFAPERLPAGWEDGLRWAHFGCISLVRQPLAGRLVALAERLHGRGVRISYDPNFRAVMDAGYDSTLARMLAIADFVKVSDEDLCGLFRTGDEVDALRRLRALNPAVPVLHTRGAAGARLHADGHCWEALPPAVQVVDTVGAGDCSVAGLLCSLMRESGRIVSEPWGEHLRVAVAAGSAACLSAGATPPPIAVVEDIAASVTLRAANAA